jgi:hypothetical protein
MLYAYQSAPTQGEIVKFQAIAKKIESKAIEIVNAKSNQSAINSLDLNYTLPRNKDEILLEWASTLNLNTELNTQQTNGIKTFDLANSENAFKFLAMAVRDKFEDDILYDLGEFCNNAVPGYLSDYWMGSASTINISWVTVKSLEQGAGIFAHEIGHAVYSKYPNLFESEKQCLGKVQSEQYFGEDFADLFSTTVMARISSENNVQESKNWACGLMKMKAGKWDVGTLDNPIKSDVHSAPIYRLLAVSSMMNQTTNQCSQYLTAIKEVRFNNYCKIE